MPSFMPTREEHERNLRRLAHMENELVQIRNLLAPFAADEGESTLEICDRVVMLHKTQAQTILALREKLSPTQAEPNHHA